MVSLGVWGELNSYMLPFTFHIGLVCAGFTFSALSVIAVHSGSQGQDPSPTKTFAVVHTGTSHYGCMCGLPAVLRHRRDSSLADYCTTYLALLLPAPCIPGLNQGESFVASVC